MSTTGTWNPLQNKFQTLDDRIASIGLRLEAIVDGHQQFRSNPVAGKFSGLKRFIYKLVNSTFTKQYEHNEQMVDLVRQVQATLQDQQEILRVLQHAPEAVVAPAPKQVTQADLSQGVSALQKTIPGILRIFNPVAQLRWPERTLIYSLVYGLKPRRMLEIGTAQGGSALIACGAMDDTGYGHLYCVDLKFQVTPQHWSMIRHRTTFIEGPSPDSLAEAQRLAASGFDFAFIDGDHTYEGLLRDIRGVLPHMTDASHLLFHDSHHDGVHKAINEALTTWPELVDCGELSTEQTVVEVADWGTNLWGGLRLLRFQRNRGQDRQ